jgi:hypothetical protein
VLPVPAPRHKAAVAPLALVLTVALASACGSGHRGGVPPPADATTSAPAGTTSTAPTTVDPANLPQTSQLPSADDPVFRQRMSELWSAIVSGQPDLATPAFFPLGAYIQVKAISDPAHDYRDRLVAEFDQDIMTLHARIGASATLVSVSVPDAARWITPGVEYNKGSYWRVYGTRVTYDVSGQPRYFTIASMISWRGEWYVVHLLSIR